MDLHEDAERLARALQVIRGNEKPTVLLTKDEADALSACLAEVERERDARVAAAYEEAVNVLKLRDTYIAPDNSEPYDRGWSRALKTAAEHILALARPEETAALDRIRAEERERAAQKADLYDELDHSEGSATARNIAKAIRGDDT